VRHHTAPAFEAPAGGIWAPFGPVEIVGSVLQDNWIDEFPEPGNPGTCFGLSRGGGVHAGAGVTCGAARSFGNHVEQCALVGGIQGARPWSTTS
jgi:hypothetical protein